MPSVGNASESATSACSKQQPDSIWDKVYHNIRSWPLPDKHTWTKYWVRGVGSQKHTAVNLQQLPVDTDPLFNASEVKNTPWAVPEELSLASTWTDETSLNLVQVPMFMHKKKDPKWDDPTSSSSGWSMPTQPPCQKPAWLLELEHERELHRRAKQLFKADHSSCDEDTTGSGSSIGSILRQCYAEADLVWAQQKDNWRDALKPLVSSVVGGVKRWIDATLNWTR
jgi:hypothetical protein